MCDNYHPETAITTILTASKAAKIEISTAAPTATDTLTAAPTATPKATVSEAVAVATKIRIGKSTPTELVGVIGAHHRQQDSYSTTTTASTSTSDESSSPSWADPMTVVSSADTASKKVKITITRNIYNRLNKINTASTVQSLENSIPPFGKITYNVNNSTKLDNKDDGDGSDNCRKEQDPPAVVDGNNRRIQSNKFKKKQESPSVLESNDKHKKKEEPASMVENKISYHNHIQHWKRKLVCWTNSTSAIGVGGCSIPLPPAPPLDNLSPMARLRHYPKEINLSE